MAESTFPYDAGAGANVTEAQWGQMAQYWLQTGVLAGQLNELLVYVNGTDYNLRTKTGRAWVAGTFYEANAEEVRAISPHATLYRKDRVVLRVNWAANTATITVLPGANAATQAAAVPAALTQTLGTSWDVPLAVVDVKPTSVAGALAVADVIDERRFAVALGADVPKQNLLTNGDFRTWQRGTGTFAGNGTWAADRWQLSGAGATFGVSRDTTAGFVDVGSEASMKVVVSAFASTVVITQKVENYLSLRGKQHTFTARAWTNNPNACRLRVTDGVSTWYSAYHPATSAFETLAITVPVSAAATTLTCDLVFDAACTVWFSLAWLNPGPVVVTAGAPHAADGFNRALRYYQVFGGTNTTESIGVGQCNSATAALVMVPITRKAIAPTITISAAADFAVTDASAASLVAATSVTAQNIGLERFIVAVGVAAGLVAGNATQLMANSTTNTRLKVEANP